MRDNSPKKPPVEGGVIAWFAQNAVAANLLMMLILVAGISSLANVRIESFPKIPPDSISISVDYTNGSAETSEEGIAIKIEEALQGIEGIKKIESTSNSEGAAITVTRTSGYNLDTLYRDVKAQVDATSLPKRAERPVITQEMFIESVVSVNLFGDVSENVLQTYAEDLRARLLKSPYIQKVAYFGKKTPEVLIEVDESQLQAMNLSIDDIAARVNVSSITETGGTLTSPNGNFILKAEQQRYNAKEFADIVIKHDAGGQRVQLKDIATITDGLTDKYNITRYNGQTSVGLDVQMFGKSSITDIADNVREIIADYEPLLPPGLEIAIWNDQSKPIEDRLSLLVKNSVQGMAMVILLLALFLNVRVAFWVGLGLPVIFLGALILMSDSLFSLTLNELTTFGFIMALGIVVDDAVVIGESIYDEREKYGPTMAATIRGANKVATPTTFGVLTTMVAFMSMALIEGELGKIFAQFAFAAAFCLFFSLIESKLILPAHLAHLRITAPQEQYGLASLWGRLQDKVIKGLRYFTHHIYKPFLLIVLKYRYAAIAVFVAVLISVMGMVTSGKIKSIFFPEISADFVTAELIFEDDAGYGLVHREMLVIEHAAEQLNQQLMAEYDLTIAPIQHLLTITSNSAASFTAGLSGNDDRPFTARDLASRWEALLPPLEGINIAIFSADMISEKDISIELRSRHNQSINEAGDVLMDELKRYSAVSGIKSGLKSGQAQINFELRPEGLAMGFSMQTLLEQIKLAYQGYEIQRVQQGENEVKVKIQYPEMQRQSLDDLQHARVRLSNGQVVPLSAVATITTKYVAIEIDRVNQNRVNLISADVNKTQISPDEILAHLQADIFPKLQHQYPDLDIVISGQKEEEDEVKRSFKGAFLVALVAIFALLAIPLKSYFQPVLIMCAIPFGIVGALLGHWLHDIPISLLSLFGILALSGVVVNDSLLLMSRYNAERAIGLSVTNALVASGTGRMRAILLTSTTTYVGLLPLLAETSPQALFLVPAAISMGYGILFATLITLILIPATVMISEDVKAILKQKKALETVS